MFQHEILQKLSGIKNNLLRFKQLITNDHGEIHIEDPNSDFPNDADDLPLTLNRESRPGIKFYTTENSSIAIGAEKEIPQGIDSFGEEDTYDEEAESEHHQNSDLSKRFYTGGLDVDEINNHK